MTSERDIAGLIRRRQVQEIHRILPQTLVANALFCCAITAWFSNDHLLLMCGWVSAVNLLSAYAMYQTKKLNLASRRGLSERAIRRTVLHTAALGCCFVSVPAWLLTRTSGPDFAILISLLTGVTWGGAVALAAVLPASLAFISVSHGLIVSCILSSTTTSGQLLLALIYLSGAYATMRCVRVQSRSFLVSERQRIDLERQGETIELLLKDFEEQTSDWLWEIDASLRYRLPSERFAEAAGRAAASIEGAALDIVFDDADAANDAAREALREQVGRRAAFRDLIVAFTSRGKTRWWSLSGRPLSDPDGAFAGFRGVCTDITIAKTAEMRIAHLAHHDALTDLPNRTFFRESLDRALKPMGDDGKLAILCLDLDGFKAVNDRYGHPAGDALLVIVAQRIRALVRSGDVLARFGGDEFMILDVAIDHPAEVEALARGIVEAISVPMPLAGEQVMVGACIGVALAPADGHTVDELLRNADAALYRAKAEGRGTYRFFSAEMDRKLQERQQMVEDMRGALRDDALVLHYQPFIASETGAVSGYEALVRWRHPRLGLLPPKAFIPLAEESGLIMQLGAWVIERACLEAATWPPHLRVSVNISPLQFRGRELPRIILSALVGSGLPSSRLEVEITETALIEDAEVALDLLRQIRALGVGIAHDDFGTGYSSLGYLRRFPFDRVKIDRSFVEDLDNRHDSRVIVKAIGDIARGLGMTITAEGVETVSQADRLREWGCEELQGFLYGRPKPASELHRMRASAA